MTSKRFIVKYNRHRDSYGIFDREQATTTWGLELERAHSEAARLNALDDLRMNLYAAIRNTQTVLTSALTPERAEAFRELRGVLRTCRESLPTWEQIAGENALSARGGYVSDDEMQGMEAYDAPPF